MAKKQVSVQLRVNRGEMLDLIKDKLLVEEAFIPTSLIYLEEEGEFVITGEEVPIKAIDKPVVNNSLPTVIGRRSLRNVMAHIFTSDREFQYDEIVKRVKDSGVDYSESSFSQTLSRVARRVRPGVYVRREEVNS